MRTTRPRWPDAAPSLVAESLALVRDLVRDALAPGPPGTAPGVAAAIAGAALPPEAPDRPPDWLHPQQVRPFRRTLHALRAAGGALLATPVGSGKTFMALAAAQALGREPPVRVVAPAVLLRQWHAVARQVGVAVELTSHERVSRGEAPGAGAVVVIDESHRFRNPGIRRYRTIAPDLIGRRVLLVTATPVVNRLADLLHQLLLAVRDDALRHCGLASLRKALAAPPVPPALAHLVITEPDRRGERPDRRELVIDDWMPEAEGRGGVLAALDRLRLSRDPGIAALIRTGLLRALASSPAALLTSLDRLGLLLEHAHEARRAGRRVGRRDVERAVGPLTDQLVLWPVLEGGDAPVELALGDRRPLLRLAARVRHATAGPDRKLALLRAMLGDGCPTVVFAAATETVHYLRRRLELPGIAWVTGARAGLDHSRCSRHAVLAAFDPGTRPTIPRAPWLLLASDVAAEGLNLQRVGRVIHYDLPWTPVRLEQRDGRAIRLGSLHPSVMVVRFDPPPAVEARLAVLERLAGKAVLPGAVGIGRRAGPAWRWHDRLREGWGDVAAEPGWAAVASSLAGAAVAVAIEHRDGGVATATWARSAGGGWSDDPALLGAVLEGARHAPPAGDGLAAIDSVLDDVAGLVRQRLRLASSLAVHAAGTPASRAAVRLAWERLRGARRDRRVGAVASADHVLEVLRRGLTAGEEQLAARAAAGDGAAWQELARLPAGAAPGPPRVRVVAALALVPPPGGGLHRPPPPD